MHDGRSTGPTASAETWHLAWAAALDALELDVTEAEGLLAAGRGSLAAGELPAPRGPWMPPALAGPLPSDLRARAEAVLARQLRVSEDLARAMGNNHRELQVARKMSSGTVDRTRPVFVDSRM